MQRIYCDKCGNDITQEYAKVNLEVGPFLRAVENKHLCEPCLMSFAALVNSFIPNFVTLIEMKTGKDLTPPKSVPTDSLERFTG